MITRQDLYQDLFKLKNAGEDVTAQLKIMESCRGIPQKVVEFLQDKSPQFQFYRDIQKNQRALMKNIINYESFSPLDKVKLCSSLITRAMIAIEYKNLDPSLLDSLHLDRIAKALDAALSHQDYSKMDNALEGHKNAMLLFYKGKQ